MKNHPRFFWVAFILLLASAFICLLKLDSRAGVAAPPQLALDKTRQDFGEVFVGEELTAGFLAANNGDAPLRLSETPLPITGRSFSLADRLLPVAALIRRAAPS